MLVAVPGIPCGPVGPSLPGSPTEPGILTSPPLISLLTFRIICFVLVWINSFIKSVVITSGCDVSSIVVSCSSSC